MRPTIFAAIVVVIASVACSKSEATSTPAPATPPPAPIVRDDAKPADATPPPIAPRVAGPVGDVLDAYDTMRLALAHDDADKAVKAASSIAVSAKTASDAATGATKQPLADLAKASEAMAKATDIASARTAFSDVTKDTVALLVADPSLQTGRFLFLCPMAKGYQKWVQTTAKLENPFYGKAMIDCGEQLKAWAI